MIQLDANENPRGMPPAAREAAAAALAASGRYPDPLGLALKQALAEHLAVPADWLTLGSGSSEILTLAAHACVAPGEGVVYSQYGFIVYGQAAAQVHARTTVVPARHFGHDLAAMRAAIGPGTRLVFVANPNDPTGSFIEPQRLLDFLAQVPAHATVLLDEAYTEYLTPEQRYDAVDWVRRFPNLLVARTFSKAYGLAGLRVGYGISQPALAQRLNAQRPRFNVGTPALAAAQAALGDAQFVRDTREANLAAREQLARGLAALGLRTLPSAGNFVTAECGDGAAVAARLLEAGIAVSPLAPYGLPGWVRITTGTAEQNAAVLGALAAIVRRNA